MEINSNLFSRHSFLRLFFLEGNFEQNKLMTWHEAKGSLRFFVFIEYVYQNTVDDLI